jgi:hypothetical protein
MDAASARNLQSKAQGIANQLRVLEPGSATDERCAKLLAELADAVRAPAAAYQLAPRNCIDAPPAADMGFASCVHDAGRCRDTAAMGTGAQGSSRAQRKLPAR